jgi:two-component sensor histidine kinase
LRRLLDRLRVRPGSAWAYLVALSLVTGAALVRWGLGAVATDISPFFIFYPATLFATLFGAVGPGLLSIVLGAAIGRWAFMSPDVPPLAPLDRGELISIAGYLTASLLIVWGTDYHRRLSARLQDAEALRRQAEELRKLAVDELGHRLKNKAAAIDAILRSQLAHNRAAYDAVSGRLRALAATDELIMRAHGAGARLADVLLTELGPYDTARAELSGPDLLLPPNLAVLMAMIGHELATNAAKYGAFSNIAGRVLISWTVVGQKLQLEWREEAGRRIAAPARKGFGTRLLSRGLDQYGGSAEISFAPTGMTCRLTLNLPPQATGATLPACA